MRVLIVDDSKTVRKKLRNVLEEEMGCEVTEVTSGEEAITLLNQEVFDLVTLDLNMEGKDGLEVCWEIREKGKNEKNYLSSLPIIFITEDNSLGIRRKGFEKGGTDFLHKGELTSEGLQLAFKRIKDSFIEFRSSRFVVIDPSLTFCKIMQVHRKLTHFGLA